MIVPIRGWNRVTERALRFALQISSEVTALHIRLDEQEDDLAERWADLVEKPAQEAGLCVPKLEVMKSPYRMLLAPIVRYVRKQQAAHPNSLLAVVVPELVQPRWYEYMLHNHYGALLKLHLLMNGNDQVVVINTPWYLREPAPAKSDLGDGQEEEPNLR